MSKSTAFLLISLLFLWACNPDKHKEVDQTTISFKTNDASKLFFKNVRQSYYDKENMEQAKLNLYRLKKRPVTEERPCINLVIVDNWRYDEAYLLLEPNGFLGTNTISLTWKNGASGKSGNILFESGNKKDIVRFADQVYYQIQQGSNFLVKVADKEIAVLENAEDREAFRITMVDYYRLVQRL